MQVMLNHGIHTSLTRHPRAMIPKRLKRNLQNVDLIQIKMLEYTIDE